MGINGTIIKPLPTRAEVETWVKQMISPETAERDAKNLIRIIHAVADFESVESSRLADAAMKAAYSMTAHYEDTVNRSFRDFALSEETAIQLYMIDESPEKEKSTRPTLIG